MKKSVIALMVSVFGLFGCQSHKKAVSSDKDLNGKFIVSKVNDAAVSVEETPYLTFNEGGKINAMLGCNFFNTTYSIAEKQQIKINNGQMTMRMCPDMEIEQSLLNGLLNSVRYELKGKTLFLYNEQGKTVVELQKD